MVGAFSVLVPEELVGVETHMVVAVVVPRVVDAVVPAVAVTFAVVLDIVAVAHIGLAVAAERSCSAGRIEVVETVEAADSCFSLQLVVAD